MHTKSRWRTPLTIFGAIISGFAAGTIIEGLFRPPSPIVPILMIFVAVVSGMAIRRTTD
jgi:F0F1-type ATP synthase membrane subunit c/vacuolar-type H+-ATPase subunit K